MPQLSAMSFVVFIGFNAAANAANTLTLFPSNSKGWISLFIGFSLDF